MMSPEQLQQYIKAISDGLSPLGDKAMGLGKTYYELAYRQAIVDGITSGLFAIGSFVCIVFLLFSAKKTESKDRAFVFIAFSVGFFCLFTIAFINAISDLGNPGYDAIGNIIDQLQKVTSSPP